MSKDFQGKGLPLDDEGVLEATDRMGIKAAELWAVLAVETRSCGFLPDRRPIILFERHVFSRETRHQHDASHSGISNRQSGGYGLGGAHQFDRLLEAVKLDRRAALESASWGIAQVMGFNANISGFADAEKMVAEMMDSENAHLAAMTGFIVHNRLDKALRAHDWKAFARGYNGESFAINRYDVKLAAQFQKYSHGAVPDVKVRAAQIYLIYLGLDPGTVDGLPGPMTFSALHEFQEHRGLPLSHTVNDALLAHLQAKALHED